jgi:hypothetical protein
MMAFDECYMPLLRHVNLLPVANIVRRGMPVFNVTAIMMMVDRWRPETHSFHLPCGDLTVTLKDVAMILGLPIRGRPVTGRGYDPLFQFGAKSPAGFGPTKVGPFGTVGFPN